MIRIQITDGSAAVRDDVDFVQVRDQKLDARALAALVRGIGARVLVNDRTDVAIACGAAGVHLRDRSISPEFVRRIAPAGFVITVSCHDAEAVLRAEAEGADYAVLAPVFGPLSKPLECLPLGLDVLRAITSRAKIPVIALGGITMGNAAACIEAGAAGIAGITLFL